MTHRRVLVIGLGAFGSAIVETLWSHPDVETIAIDANSDAVDPVKRRTDAAFVGDGSDPRVLHDVGARDVDVAVVSFGEDFEASVLCVASLKQLGVSEIIARAASERQAHVLRAVGATRVLQLEREMGARLGAELFSVVSSELLDFAHGYRVVPWVAKGEAVGKTLAEAALRSRYDVTVLGFKQDGGSAAHGVLPVQPTQRIREGDTLLLVAEEKAMAKFLADH